jgi:hypothetical protein
MAHILGPHVVFVLLASTFAFLAKADEGGLSTVEEQCALIDMVWCTASDTCVLEEPACTGSLTDEQQCALIDMVWCTSSNACVLEESACILTDEQQCALIDMIWCTSSEACVYADTQCPPAAPSLDEDGTDCGTCGGALTPCGAHAETQHEGTSTEDRVCVCSDGFFSSTHAGGAFEECVTWSACDEGTEVSIAGTTSTDQVCGLKLVASAVVPMAISDMDAFKAQIASESGSPDAVVQITNFEQQVASAATLPGSASDYESDDAKTQFRTGVATALGVDLAAVSDITVTSSTGRRLLNSNSSGGEARRLQSSSVSISYVVTVT